MTEFLWAAGGYLLAAAGGFVAGFLQSTRGPARRRPAAPAPAVVHASGPLPPLDELRDALLAVPDDEFFRQAELDSLPRDPFFDGCTNDELAFWLERTSDLNEPTLERALAGVRKSFATLSDFHRWYRTHWQTADN